MTSYQIKKSLLFRAIQGKLVYQDKSEGSGKALIEENNTLALGMPLSTQKRIGKGCKPIKNEENLFEIPDNWIWERFGNLVINYDSQRKPVSKDKRKTINGTYNYYGATGAIDRVDEYLFDGEFLMIGEDGGNFFVDRDNSFIAKGKFWANNHVHVVKPIVCQIEYLKICLDAYDLPNMGLINGIAVPKLNQVNLNSILIPIPPLDEQKRIVEKIEELLPYVDRYEKAWSKLEDFNKRFPGDMQKSVLQMAIQGKLVEQRPEEGTGEELYRQIQAEKKSLIKSGKFQKEKPLPEISEDEIPFDIPESWKWVRLENVCKSVVDGDHQPPPQVENGVPFLVISNVSMGKMDFSNTRYVPYEYFNSLSNDRIAENGDLLFTVTGSYGIPIKVDCERKFCFQRHIALLKIFLDWNYMFFLLKSPVVKNQCDKVATGTAQKTVGLRALRNIVIPIPPLAEQKRIVQKLEEILPLCEKLK